MPLHTERRPSAGIPPSDYHLLGPQRPQVYKVWHKRYIKASAAGVSGVGDWLVRRNPVEARIKNPQPPYPPACTHMYTWNVIFRGSRAVGGTVGSCTLPCTKPPFFLPLFGWQIMIVGDSGLGKTTLVRALLSTPHEQLEVSDSLQVCTQL